MARTLKVVAWNIAEGRHPNLPDDGALSGLAQHIWSQNPDLVLINEAKNQREFPFGTGVNQVARLAEMTGMSYVHWGNTVATGATGHKAVGVLSKFPLGAPQVHPVIRDGSATAFATLETSIQLDGLTHRIFSTRFAPHNSADHEVENRLGVQQAITLVQRQPAGDPVIFGGDFNARPEFPQMASFFAQSGLRDAFQEMPDPQICDANNRIDYVFFRGPYNVKSMTQRCQWPPSAAPSDHPILVVEMESTLPTEHPECVSIRQNIAAKERQIIALREAKKGLNPKDPLDREEIDRINAEIADLSAQVTAMRNRAAELGCR